MVTDETSSGGVETGPPGESVRDESGGPSAHPGETGEALANWDSATRDRVSAGFFLVVGSSLVVLFLFEADEISPSAALLLGSFLLVATGLVLESVRERIPRVELVGPAILAAHVVGWVLLRPGALGTFLGLAALFAMGGVARRMTSGSGD